ncbi:hypothetical protein Sjap_015753 [Stephania japonica]|uniref:non-specific serine/threonine protein kinase n=1 Tax=Stephania japonica TaxID=461633 RepID=A0AAP0ILB7_9MAGN
MESFLSNVVFFVTTLVVAMNIFLVHSSFSSNDTSRSSDVVKASMQDQVDALLAWKRSLTFYGYTWLNSWSTDTALYPTVCDWEGIACDDMGRLVRIEMHSRSLKCNLSTSIPSQIGNLTKLTMLDLSFNVSIGSLPQSIGQLRSLFVLDLSNNLLTGSIPTTIGTMLNLSLLHLSYNQLVGCLPQSIGQLYSLRSLDLSINKLIGPIPATIGNMTNLEEIVLSSNQLVGSLPQSIGQLKSLVSLHLSTNKLTGPIPTTIGDMSSLFWLSLQAASNTDHLLQFSSSSSASKVKDLRYPSTFGTKNINKRKPKRLNIIVLATTVLVFVLIGVFLGSTCRWNSRKARTNKGSTKHGNIFSIWNYDGQIAYEDIIRETEEFDIKYCIGVGGHGSVYRALLPSGKVVALKKFHNWERENLTFEKSFTIEIQVLTKIRHRNIMKLYGFCCHTRCAFLVFEYLEKGSVFVVLAEEAEAVVLDGKGGSISSKAFHLLYPICITIAALQ